MPHLQRFTGPVEEDFPAPPISRRLYPGDVVEYDADEPAPHARLELVDAAPAGWERFPHHVEGLSAVWRDTGAAARETPVKPKTKKAAEDSLADPKKE